MAVAPWNRRLYRDRRGCFEAPRLTTTLPLRGADAVAALYLPTKDLYIRRYAAQLGARQVIPDLMADRR